MPVRRFLTGLLVLLPVIVQAQAPRTISHQGVLTDASGDPVPDAIRSILFGLHPTKSNSGAFWSETQSVATVNGVFHVELGAVNPINIQLDRELWLSIKVGSDPQMTPRTRIASVPTAMALLSPVRDTIRIAPVSLGADGSELRNEALTVHAFDAQIGLYSDPVGSAGSGLQLGEIVGGSLSNKWTMYRGTTGSNGGLRFSFGQSPSYGANSTRVEFDTSGVVNATGARVDDEYKYSSRRTRFLQLPAAVFRIDDHDQNANAYLTRWEHKLGYIQCTGCFRGDGFLAPIQLPDQAEVKKITIYFYDNDGLQDSELGLHNLEKGPPLIQYTRNGQQPGHNLRCLDSNTVPYARHVIEPIQSHRQHKLYVLGSCRVQRTGRRRKELPFLWHDGRIRGRPGRIERGGLYSLRQDPRSSQLTSY